MRRSPLRTQIVALGILIVASVVGNVAASASRNRTDSPSAVAVAPGDEGVRTAFVSAASDDGLQVQQRTVRDREGASHLSPGDDGQIVPAIYSWDPDVTFVFYRHVTKWM